jgi:hypothetical protein
MLVAFSAYSFNGKMEAKISSETQKTSIQTASHLRREHCLLSIVMGTECFPHVTELITRLSKPHHFISLKIELVMESLSAVHAATQMYP